MRVWIVLGLGFAAFAALSLAMERHQEQVFGRALARRASIAWRLLGWALLLVSLQPCLALGGPALAVTAWLGALSFGALGLGLLLSYAPRATLPASAAVLAWAATVWAWSA